MMTTITRGETVPGTNAGSFAPHLQQEADTSLVTSVDTFTVVPILYVDGANYKASGSFQFAGRITDEQLARARATLDGPDGNQIVLEQLVGIHLGAEMASFPDRDDHPWHDVLLDEIEVNGMSREPIFRYPDAEAFVAALEAIGKDGWDPIAFATDYDDEDFDLDEDC